MRKSRFKMLSILLAAALLLPTSFLAQAAQEEVIGVEIPVLLYHRVVENPTNEWTDTSLDTFKATMQYLHENGYNTVSAADYVAIKKGQQSAPEKPILLTFDDATPDFATITVPILNEFEMNAVQFVVSGWIDGGYSMSLTQLKQLIADHPNISFQPHSSQHVENEWNQMTEEEASADFLEVNRFIQSLTGKAPTLFAYPYGQYNDAVQAAAAANGIVYAFKVGYPDQGDQLMGRHYIKMETTLSDIANWLGGPQPETEQVTIYHETFADGAGLAKQSGDAKLSVVTDKVFADNPDGAALYVSNRTNSWDAADFTFADLGLVEGKTYTATVHGYVDADVIIPDGAQTYLQLVDSYTWLAGADFRAGESFTMSQSFTVDATADKAIRVQSNDAAVSVPYYISEILITAQAGSTSSGVQEVDDREPALPFTTLTFEDGTPGNFEGRAGTETLTVTTEANHTTDGSYALKVENRADAWHGPALRIEQYITKGHEYAISAWVKLISPDSAQLQLSTQVGSTTPSYNNLASATIHTSDGWVQLKGTYRYTSISDEFLTIYIESSNNSTASFYIDDIQIETTDTGLVSVQKDLTPIKDAYKDDFLIGSAINATELAGVRLDLLTQHHNAATAENAMKPESLQAEQGVFTFEGADALVDGARQAGLDMFGHVLVWHQQSPAWMNTTTDEAGELVHLERAEALDHMRTHIQTVVEHFGDRVIGWDVVNEAMNDNPANPEDWKGALRQSAWYHAIGDDFVEQAFLAAREVLDANPDWDVKLYYNDYNDDNQNKAEAIYQMVKEINERYAAAHPGKRLIDGIGMQGHYETNTNPENVRRSLEKFISLGVEVSITELDVRAGENGVLSEEEARAQGYLYAQLFSLYKEHATHIARVTFWGLDDATSWRVEQNPLLFDKNMQAKPAYYAVMDPASFIAEHPPAAKITKESVASYGTPIIDGTIDPVWESTPAISLNQFQMAWQGATGVAKVLWDEQNLYVLIQVSDSQLDKSSPNPWEQDSVEVFLDQNNEKTTFYQDDDGQYRVNFENETSFGSEQLAEGFESATHVSGTQYTIEMKIPLSAITPAENMKIGFDAQVNDGKDGARQSVASWNDKSGMAYMDTSVFGVLTLVKTAFVDLQHFEWARPAIEALVDKGYMNGTSSTTFSPAASISKADYVTLLVQALEDSGLQASSFGDELATDPDGNITRKDMMRLTAKALAASSKQADASEDGDEDALVQSGIVVGKEHGLALDDILTRSEAAAIVYRVLAEQ